MICVDEVATTYPENKNGEKKDHSILIIYKMALVLVGLALMQES